MVALFALGFGAVAAFALGHPQVCVCVCACICVCVCVCVYEKESKKEGQYARSVCWALAPCGKYNPVYDRASMTDHRKFHKIFKFFCTKKGGPKTSYFISCV